MKGFHKLLITIMFVLCFPFWLSARESNLNWEPSSYINSNFKLISKQPDIEIFLNGSFVEISVNKPLIIKIFTILGKEISSQFLDPGIYELNLNNNHGVYIIKTEQTTCKIAI